MPFNPGNKRAQRARNVPTVGGPMKFGLYPTVGVSLPFLRLLQKCCSGCGANFTAPCGVTVQVCKACGVPDTCSDEVPRGSCVSKQDINNILGGGRFPERYCQDCCEDDETLEKLTAELAECRKSQAGGVNQIIDHLQEQINLQRATEIFNDAFDPLNYFGAADPGILAELPTAILRVAKADPPAVAAPANICTVTGSQVRNAINTALDVCRKLREQDHASALVDLADGASPEKLDLVNARCDLLSAKIDVATAEAGMKLTPPTHTQADVDAAKGVVATREADVVTAQAALDTELARLATTRDTLSTEEETLKGLAKAATDAQLVTYVLANLYTDSPVACP